MLKKIILFLGGFLFCFLPFSVLQAGVEIELDSRAKIMFPSVPELIDTLGQLSYSMSDASGYYACIVYSKALSADKIATLNREKFYLEMFEKMQDPSHGCKLIRKQVINNQDILGMEFYTQCEENEDFPGIRYKQLFLYAGTLYVIDYWTQNKLSENAENYKLAFFNLFSIKKDEEAYIPSAFEIPKSSKTRSFQWTNYIGFLAAIGILAFLFLGLRKKPKK